MEEVLRQLPADECFRRKGDKVAMRSFWAWPVRMWKELRSWHSLLVVLIHLGLMDGAVGAGVALQFKERAKRKTTTSGAASSSSSSSAAVAPPPEMSEAKSEEKRVQFKNTVHLVALFLSDMSKYTKAIIIAACAQPLAHNHFMS